MKKLLIVLTMAIILCASTAWGQSCDHYITPAGGGSKNGTSWASAYDGSTQFSNGIEDTTAGETLCIGGGTYISYYEDSGSAWDSHNSGSSGNEITWTASDDGVYGGEVVLQHNNGNNMSISHNYIIITGTATNTITHYSNYENNYIPLMNITGDNGEIANVKLYRTSYETTNINHSNIGIELSGADYWDIHDVEAYNLGGVSCDNGMGGPIEISDGSTNNEIYGCTLYSSYNGINFARGSGNNNNLIHDNIVYSMENGGITVDGASNSNDNEVYDNTVYDCDVGNINIWHGSSTAGTGWKIYRNLLYFTEGRRYMDGIFIAHLDSSEIYNNVIYDGGFGTDGTCSANGDFRGFKIYNTANNNEIYNNTIYSTDNGSTRAIMMYDAGGHNNTFKNNVAHLTSSAGGGGYAVYYDNADNDTWENNAWYSPNKSNHFSVNGANRNFSYWQGLGYDSPTGYNENPDFKNTSNLPTAAARTNDGLMPDSGASSPLIDNGADLSGTFTLDFLEATRGANFDIGAYEYSVGGADTTPPTLSSATIASDGVTVSLVFDETVVTTFYDNGDLDLDCVSTGNDISLDSMSGTGSTRTVTAASAVLTGDSCNIDYTGGANEIEDTSGNDMVTCNSCATVTNNSDHEVAAPTLTDATVSPDGLRVTLTFDELVQVGAGGNAGWTVTPSGGAATLSYFSGSGLDTWIYILSRFLMKDETLTIDYTQPGDGVQDAAGNDLASISSGAVTNGSDRGITGNAVGGTYGRN